MVKKDECNEEKAKKSCLDIVRAMSAKEKGWETYEYTGEYARKLYPFLKELYRMDKLDINGDFNIGNLKDDTYRCLKNGMVEFVQDYGKIYQWIPSKIQKGNLDIHIERWTKDENALEFMFRLRKLLFEVAARENPEIKDKSYYDRLYYMAREYNREKWGKKHIHIGKEPDLQLKKSLTIENLEEHLTSLKEKKSQDDATIHISKAIYNTYLLLKRKYSKANIDGQYMDKLQQIEKEMERYSNKVEHSHSPSYFEEYLILSLKKGEYQFPYDLYGVEEEIYYQCKAAYWERAEYSNFSSDEELKGLIKEIRQKVYKSSEI